MSAATRPTAPPGAAELARQIAAGQATACQVVEAHLARIEQVNPRLNAVTQPLFDEARAAARRADAAQAAGEPLGPLHGVPVTIKDCFAVRGADSTLGIAGRSRGAATDDAPLVTRLRAAGAIVLGKTNVPQGMLVHECSNPLFGRTLHPFDDERSPGGSSGGEAAIVAAGGVPLGLGSDLGGSIRQPAAACGVCGLKPTSYRLSTRGSDRIVAGMRAMPIAPGPIARRVEDLDLAMRVLSETTASPRQSDEWCPGGGAEWPDYQQVDIAKLRIAWWTDDGMFPVAAGVGRAVEQAAARLAALGADVRRVAPPTMSESTHELMRIYFGLISADGMRSMQRAIGGSEKDPQIAKQLLLARVPRFGRWVLGGLMRLAGQRRTADLLRWTGPRSTDEYWRLTLQADDFRAGYWTALDQAFAAGENLAEVDAVLAPPYGLPALRHESALHLIMAASHCFLANLLDAPAGVVPWGEVTAEDERRALATGASPWTIGGRYARANARDSAGLPLGVQAMARPWRDDVVLAVLAALESAADRVTPARPTK